MPHLSIGEGKVCRVTRAGTGWPQLRCCSPMQPGAQPAPTERNERAKSLPSLKSVRLALTAKGGCRAHATGGISCPSSNVSIRDRAFGAGRALGHYQENEKGMPPCRLTPSPNPMGEGAGGEGYDRCRRAAPAMQHRGVVAVEAFGERRLFG